MLGVIHTLWLRGIPTNLHENVEVSNHRSPVLGEFKLKKLETTLLEIGFKNQSIYQKIRRAKIVGISSNFWMYLMVFT